MREALILRLERYGRERGWSPIRLDQKVGEGPRGGEWRNVTATLGPVTGEGSTTNAALNRLADGLVEHGWPDDRGE